jgi:hypothetical protein
MIPGQHTEDREYTTISKTDEQTWKKYFTQLYSTETFE